MNPNELNQRVAEYLAKRTPEEKISLLYRKDLIKNLG
jgi:hypothetical protein